MMISVNLRPGVRRGRAAPSFSVGFGGLKSLGSRLKDPLPALTVLAWVGALGFLGYTFFRTSGDLGRLEPRLEEARVEHERFQDFLRQKRREEATRDSILSQIRAIREIDDERYVWPHILDEVARSIPPLTWLVEVAAVEVQPAVADTLDEDVLPPVEVQLTGRTADIQGYTRLMRELEASPWLGNITAVSAATVVEQGRAVTAFVLRATYTPAETNRVPAAPAGDSGAR